MIIHVNQQKIPEQNIFVRVNWCVSMLLDLSLVKHFRMRRDRKRRSAAASAIYMVMYKVYRSRLCRTKPWLMNRDLGIDTNPGPRNVDRRQKDSLFCMPCKRLRVFV